MLEINNLSLLKKEKQILKGLTFNIPRNRVTMLLGKSGSGKSTLLRCIAQLEKQYLGAICYQKTPLNQFSPKQLGQTVGFISQSFPLFPHMNVLDNCASVLRILFKTSKNIAENKAREVLHLFDMEAFKFSFPHHLSGGQQQRVCIARALMLKPDFLLFDEPTSALDPENTDRFIDVIEELLQKETGVVIASQDMNLSSKLLDLSYFLEEGRFIEKYNVEDGKPLLYDSEIGRFLLKNSIC
jgi:ABC-type polar amino acid transport system ATPase subunit